jgi:HPt (histidine-containing phosphotransfer) domain-containing protein
MGGSEKSCLNLKRLADNVGLDEDEYLSLLLLFIETSKTYLHDIKSAIQEGDSTKVYETTHTIRGAADNLGIYDMAEIAKKIEVCARQNILEGVEEATDYLLDKLAFLAKVYH